MAKLNLKNPIIFFDLETTGTDINKDRIVEISYIKVYPNGNEESRNMRINPGMHIPESSSQVHGIKDEDVKDCPLFKDIAKNLSKVFEGCDIAGFIRQNAFFNQGRIKHTLDQFRSKLHALLKGLRFSCDIEGSACIHQYRVTLVTLLTG